MIPLPPKLSDLRAGTQLIAGLGKSTILPDFDFETYSSAGFVWSDEKNNFIPLKGARVKGLSAVGAAVYSEHPSTEILSCAYDLKDGKGRQLWLPSQPNPTALLQYVESGGILEAWYSFFECSMWNNVCVRLYGWPPLPIGQLRCAMAKARAFGLPGSLAAAGDVLKTNATKDKEGKRLLKKFSIPRKPTKGNIDTRILLANDTSGDAEKLYAYNLRDIETEAEISSRIPDLIPSELEFWLADQRINARGIRMDKEAIEHCINIILEAYERYNRRLYNITNGEIKSASKLAQLAKWIRSRGVDCTTLDAEAVTELLKQKDLPEDVRKALEIRELIGSAAVKKLYAMMNTLTSKERICDLFIFHSARTGRAAGAGVQPQNLPNSGDVVNRCSHIHCTKHFSKDLSVCPWCGETRDLLCVEWNPKAVEDALSVTASDNLDCVEYFFSNAISTISGCLRGMFIASPGHDLICSDYSAIEAVVLAALAGEKWQTDVFKTHGMIYEMTASKISGIPFDEFLLYKSTSGHHHSKRKLGKVAALASGYGSWVGGWKAFGADEFLNDDEIKTAILAWRDASPSIVEMWGGQPNWKRQEYYGLEGAAIQAVLNPGMPFSFRGITYFVKSRILYCQLLSGRHIVYHKPELYPSDKRPGTHSLTFEGWNTNPKYGAVGWVRMATYGGKLTENVVQATARDILAHAIVNLEKACYPVVLHVHDEIVTEVPEGVGSIAEVETIMATMPEWAMGWPIRAAGGWRAKRYAK
jgi:DNA polymerase